MELLQRYHLLDSNVRPKAALTSFTEKGGN
jgi:hypothetical protein